MTACPTAHTFEWRAGRLVGIRFRLDNGTDVLIGARTAVCTKTEEEAAEEWRAEEKAHA